MGSRKNEYDAAWKARNKDRVAEYSRRWWEQNGARVKEERRAARAEIKASLPPPPPYVPPTEKPCSHCKVAKPLEAFGAGQCRDGRDSWCCTCANAAKAARVKHLRATDPAWREASAEKKRAARRAQDPTLVLRDMERAVAAAQAELIASQCAAHVDARAVWMARCDAHVVAWQAQPKPPKPRPSSPPQSRAYERAKTARRRARRIGRTVPWSTIGDTLPVYEQAVALEAETGEEWHVDHIVPLRGETVSGLHVPANLLPLPRAINEAKKNLFA